MRAFTILFLLANFSTKSFSQNFISFTISSVAYTKKDADENVYKHNKYGTDFNLAACHNFKGKASKQLPLLFELSLQSRDYVIKQSNNASLLAGDVYTRLAIQHYKLYYTNFNSKNTEFNISGGLAFSLLVDRAYLNMNGTTVPYLQPNIKFGQIFQTAIVGMANLRHYTSKKIFLNFQVRSALTIFKSTPTNHPIFADNHAGIGLGLGYQIGQR